MIDGFLLSAAFEDVVEAQGLEGQNPRHDVCLLRVRRPVSPGRAGGLEAGGDFFGHKDAASFFKPKTEANAQPDRPAPRTAAVRL